MVQQSASQHLPSFQGGMWSPCFLKGSLKSCGNILFIHFQLKQNILTSLKQNFLVWLF